MRHDAVVKRLVGGLNEKGYSVESEFTFPLQGGALKPDVVATKSDGKGGTSAVILDVQIVSGLEPRVAHECKVRKYSERPDLIAAIRSRHRCTNVQTVAATLTWRGVWVPESFNSLRGLGLSSGLLAGLVTRVLRGTLLTWYTFGRRTDMYRRTGIG